MAGSTFRRALLIAAIGGSALVFSPGVRADDPIAKQEKTDDPTGPDAVLKDKGLHKVGFRLVLPVEADIHDLARTVKLAKGKQNLDANAVKAIDKKIKDAKDELHAEDAQFQKLGDSMATAADHSEQRQIEAQMKAVESKAKDQQEVVNDLLASKKKLTDGKEAYVEAVIEAAEKAEGATHAYDDLAADADLTAAIDKANESIKGTKLKLGPTQDFKEDLDYIAKRRAEITMEVVPVTTDQGVPMVTATVNGKKEQMVWDSGASTVLLSSAVATEVGLKPTDKDPVIQCKLADGKIINCKQMTIKTVALGAFTVSDVECAIMPPEITDVQCLLGDSFQSHFMTKLDQAGGQLRLTPLDTNTVKNAVVAKPAVKKD